MKIFVTGASGYIGSLLTRRLAAEGHDVIALTRRTPVFHHPRVAWRQASLFDAKELYGLMQDCRQVYHLAGLGKLWVKDPAEFYRVNVAGTEAVLHAAEMSGIDKLVYCSSAGVFGHALTLPLTEDDNRLSPLDNHYDTSKHLAENKVFEYAARGGHAVIVNPSKVYGISPACPDGSYVGRLVARFLNRSWYALPGSGDTVANYAYIGDVVEGHIRAMESGRSGERYILGGVNASYREFFETLSQVTGLQRKAVSIPVPVIYGWASLAKAWHHISGKSPVVMPGIVSGLFVNHQRLDVGKAKTELGYRVTPLAEGLARLAHALQPGLQMPGYSVEHLPFEMETITQ